MEQGVTKKGNAEQKKKGRSKTMSHVAFCSITHRQLHEFLNSAVSGKRRVKDVKQAIMNQITEINSKSATSWSKIVAGATLSYKTQHCT